jgi:hypothetical protein
VFLALDETCVCFTRFHPWSDDGDTIRITGTVLFLGEQSFGGYVGFSLGKKMGKFAQAFCFCLSVLGCWAVFSALSESDGRAGDGGDVLSAAQKFLFPTFRVGAGSGCGRRSCASGIWGMESIPLSFGPYFFLLLVFSVP